MDTMGELGESPKTKEWGTKSVSADSGYGGDFDKQSGQQIVGRSQSMRSRVCFLFVLFVPSKSQNYCLRPNKIC